MSYPVPGKHVAFNGRLLHGCPAELQSKTDGRRLTVLVNVWVNHIPVGLQPLNAAIADAEIGNPMGQLPTKLSTCGVPLLTLRAKQEAAALTPVTLPALAADTGVTQQ
eukprot:SAG31_NODE_2676_length_5264_cov_576.907278_5_plen_108_part_00